MPPAKAKRPRHSQSRAARPIEYPHGVYTRIFFEFFRLGIQGHDPVRQAKRPFKTASSKPQSPHLPYPNPSLPFQICSREAEALKRLTLAVQRGVFLIFADAKKAIPGGGGTPDTVREPLG